MTRTTTTTTLGVLAALLLVPGLLTGCSGGNGDGPGSGSGPSSSAGHAATAAKLGDCMRKKGHDVSDDDLAVSGGKARFAVPDGVDAQQWTDDLATCAGTSASAGQAAQVTTPPGYEEADEKATACIREQGFDDYPDDEEARGSYHPADEGTFTTVAKKCYDEAFEELHK